MLNELSIRRTRKQNERLKKENDELKEKVKSLSEKLKYYDEQIKLVEVRKAEYEKMLDCLDKQNLELNNLIQQAKKVKKNMEKNYKQFPK